MSLRDRGQKGTFGEARLPVARKYLLPGRRSLMLVVGGCVALLVVLFVLFDFWGRDARFVSNGPLSSSHATLEGDCSACHTPFRSVGDDQCSVCHEKHGDDLGTYTFEAHYLYRSSDFQRAAVTGNELPCAACHPEHLGRAAEITAVPDQRCQTCHEIGSFNRDHPQFAFATAGQPDDEALLFSHLHHVRRVMDEEGLADVERSCLYCHVVEPDGRQFEPIDFERSCDACHLTAASATPRLPIASQDRLGVATLASLRDSGRPGTAWAFFTSPGEFRELGSTVEKSPLYHRDPWILENLRQLRQRIYPDAGLADLLAATPDAPASDLEDLYREALATLEAQALGLRSRPEPEIQADLQKVEAQLEQLRRAVDDPLTPLDETEFQLALATPNPDLDEAQLAEINQLADQLTAPCQQCHRIDNATIARVQKDQRTLRRAEFDHSVHILQARCLDCHQTIPIQQFIEHPEQPIDPARDGAAIYNLPTIETCRECHTPRLAANTCVTCHDFHPDKSRRSRLLLYLD